MNRFSEDPTRHEPQTSGEGVAGETPGPEMSDERLDALVAELPREVQPESDLWPALSSRLAPREPYRSSEPALRADRRGTLTDWALRVAAAFFFMALGGALTLWLASPDRFSASGTVAESPDSGTTALVSHTDRQRASSSIDVLEAEYLQAKEVLWSRAIENRDALPPGTLKVVEKNLEILELAIRDLRRALELDPGNPDLERRLMDQHKRSIEVLRKVVREV